MDQAIAAEEPVRAGRFWLYAPISLLVLIAIGWSVAWFVIRNQAVRALDGWLAAEGNAGRQWTCEDRTVSGYPFEIELRCGSLSFKQGPVTASLGGFRSIAEVYQPRFVISEIDGPLQVSDGVRSVHGTWTLLQSSLHSSSAGLQRASIVADNSSFTVTGLGPDALTTSSQHFEIHARPNPARMQEGAYDVALTAKQAKLPALDALLGDQETTDIQMDATATHAGGFRGQPAPQELERWRIAGGKIDLLMLSLTRGMRRLETKGEIGLDDAHRPTGQLSLMAAGINDLVGKLIGKRAGLLLGALFGQNSSVANLVPLPPLTFSEGRVAIGPIILGNVQIPALY